jgi:hypothetical protein
MIATVADVRLTQDVNLCCMTAMIAMVSTRICITVTVADV